MTPPAKKIKQRIVELTQAIKFNGTFLLRY